MDRTGVIGILIFLAGAYLLWQARWDILYWLQEFLRILRSAVTRRGGLGAEPAPWQPHRKGPARRNRTALRLAGGFALVFLGQLLIFISIAF